MEQLEGCTVMFESQLVVPAKLRCCACLKRRMRSYENY